MTGRGATNKRNCSRCLLFLVSCRKSKLVAWRWRAVEYQNLQIVVCGALAHSLCDFGWAHIFVNQEATFGHRKQIFLSGLWSFLSTWVIVLIPSYPWSTVMSNAAFARHKRNSADMLQFARNTRNLPTPVPHKTAKLPTPPSTNHAHFPCLHQMLLQNIEASIMEKIQCSILNKQTRR